MEYTYKIIGGDGVEYGPVGLEELKNWVLDGRVASGTQVWRSDLSRWGSASNYTELRPELGRIEASEAESSVRPVGFWPRVGAYLIDAIVLQGIFLAIWGPGPSTIPTTANGVPDFGALMREFGPQIQWFLLIQMVYNVFLNGQFGATLGKLAIGARIVNADGSPLGFGRALLRFLSTIITQFTLGAGFLLTLIRPDRRALHDLLAGTRVIYRQPRREVLE